MAQETAAISAQVAAFLDSHHVMSLATIGPDGPHAANLFYARDGFALMWVSDAASCHSVAVETPARVAATIAMDYADFPEIQGLQMFGRAFRVVDDPSQQHARRCLEARYPFLRGAEKSLKELGDAYRRAQFYRLEPIRIVLIDNSRGFGFKQALELGLNT